MGDVRWRTLSLAFLVLSLTYSAEGQYGAMSIDLGSQFIKVGFIKPGVPMEIVLNKESRRKTPNVLSIRNGERLFGDAAQGLAARYPASVYSHLYDLVAKHVNHPSVEMYRQRFPHLKLEKHVNNSAVVFPIGDINYPVETLLAMMLTHVREFTEAYAEQSIRDVVISVPAFFTQPERMVITKAAEIAKLNVLQLINDGTAAALDYGVFRQKEITEKPQRLMIYDMGASKTVATLVEYRLAKAKNGKEPKLTVLGVGFDRTLGGLEMTLRLRDLLVKMFKAHYKTQKDITTNERAMAKMLKEAERLKQVLSANPEHYAQVESIHEDIDMKLHVTRDEFNSLIDGLMKRVPAPIEQALKMAELTMDQVDQIVLMGAGTRVPRVQEELQKFVGSKELGRFLNTDEAIAMGALFQAAHLSKGFKVKPFGVEDLVIHPVQVNFISRQKQENGEVIEKPITRQVFQYKSIYPTPKKTITFTSYTDDFSFDLNYPDLTHFNEVQLKEFDNLTSHLTTVSVSGLAKALEEKMQKDQTEFMGVKVAFQMDLSGICQIEKAEAVIQRKSQGVVESITKTISGFFSSKTEEGEPTTEERKDEESSDEEKVVTEDASPKDEKTAQEKSDQSAEEEKPKEEKRDESKEDASSETKEKDEKETASKKEEKNVTAEAKKKIPEISRVALKTEQIITTTHLMSKAEVAESKKILEQFEKREKHARERAAAENDLEGYAFEVSQILDNENFVLHSTDDERNKIGEETKRIRTWLEDDTKPDTKTAEFTKNHVTLKALVRPVLRRVEEAKTLPEAIKNLESILNSSRIMANMGGDDEKSLFNKSDADAFAKKLDRLESWFTEKKEEQAKRKPNEDPALLTSEVAAKLKALDRELGLFMKKMRQTKLEDLEKMMKKKDADGKEKAENVTESEKEGEKAKEGEQPKEKADKEKEEEKKEKEEEKKKEEAVREAEEAAKEEL